MTISWHGASVTTRGAIGSAIALIQARADLVERLAEADAVDVAVGGQPGDQHRAVEAPALAIGRLREQERLALLLRDAAAILPAHQRMHLGVFVDRLVDHDEQACARQRQHVLVQVGIAARVPRRPVAVALERAQRAGCRSIVHRRLEQSLDGGSRGERLGVPVAEADHLQAERQPFILEHRQRDRRNAEQRGGHGEGRIAGRLQADRRGTRAPTA